MPKLEKDECYAFVEYLQFRGLFFTHVANEYIAINRKTKKPDWGMVNHRKKMGVVKGFPDYIIVVPPKRSRDNHGHMIFIEMKQEKRAYPTKEQQEWIDVLNQIPGNIALVAYGFQDAVNA